MTRKQDGGSSQAIMWLLLLSAYQCVALLVCVLCQPVHSAIPASARFVFRFNLIMDICYSNLTLHVCISIENNNYYLATEGHIHVTNIAVMSFVIGV